MDTTEMLRELIGGPGTLRFVIQPLVATLLGVRDGRLDAAADRTPFVQALLSERGDRAANVRSAAHAVAKPFAVAVVIDALLQHYVAHRVVLWVSLVVGLLLIALPYSLARGLGNRAAQRARHAHAHRDLTAN